MTIRDWKRVKNEKHLMNDADFRECYEEQVREFVDSYSIEDMIEMGLLKGVPEIIQRFEDYLERYYSDVYHGDIVDCMEQLSDYNYKVATEDMLDDLMWVVMSRDIIIPFVKEQMSDK